LYCPDAGAGFPGFNDFGMVLSPELDAFGAATFLASAIFAVLLLNFLPVTTVVVVVVDVSVSWRILQRIRVVRRHFSHVSSS
jgi:hypothetical protein